LLPYALCSMPYASLQSQIRNLQSKIQNRSISYANPEPKKTRMSLFTHQPKTKLPKNLSQLSKSSSSIIKTANNIKKIQMVISMGNMMLSKDRTLCFFSLDSDFMVVPFLSISIYYLFLD
jgi:hypothetical protein